uniref:Uncharacterized protein n=1 Tax=viral metagenome TaxID=1070528 RepID=A0A6C0B8P6_9ZZZZ
MKLLYFFIIYTSEPYFIQNQKNQYVQLVNTECSKFGTIITNTNMNRHLRKDDKKCGKEAIFFKIITVPYYFLV